MKIIIKTLTGRISREGLQGGSAGRVNREGQHGEIKASELSDSRAMHENSKY